MTTLLGKCINHSVFFLTLKQEEDMSNLRARTLENRSLVNVIKQDIDSLKLAIDVLLTSPSFYGAWDEFSEYIVGDSVVVGSRIYRSLVPNIAVAPDASPLVWELLYGGSSSAVPSTLMERDENGDSSVRQLNVSDTPIMLSHAVSKGYVDNLINGLAWKESVVVKTTSVLPTYTVSGTSLTAVANGGLVVDGVVVASGDRVLVYQSVGDVNAGIYEVVNTGDDGNPWMLTRTVDADNQPDGELRGGCAVNVVNGTQQGQWILVTTTYPIVLGTTPQTWTQLGSGIVPVGGDLSGFSNSATVQTVGGLSSATIATGVSLANESSSIGLGKIVRRDENGDFSAGTITATLSGNASSATIADDVPNDIVIAKTLTDFTNGAGSITSDDSLLSAIEKLYGIVASSGAASSSNIEDRLVLRGTNGDFSAGTITATLNGNAASATTATTAASATTASTAETCTTVPAMSGEATSSGASNEVTLDNDAVIGKKLTGFTPITGEITEDDSLLGAIKKLYGIVASSGSASSSNIADRLVLRGTGGDFSAGTITATLNGNASSATVADSATSAETCTTVPALSGEATTSGSSNAITLSNAAVIGKELTNFTKSAGTITSGDSLLSAIEKLYGIVASNEVATSSNIADRLVLRSTNGDFAAGTITAALNGNASSATMADSATTASSADDVPNAIVIAKTLTDFGTPVAGTITSTDSILTAIQKLYAIVANSGAATSSNIEDRLVLRGTNGDFSAGTITATLSGNATTANSATTAGTCTIVPVLSGEASTTGTTNAVTLANAAVIGKKLTGFTSTAGTIGEDDSILTAIQKLYAIVASSGAATSSNTDDRLVLRGTNGDFSAGTITAALSGNATSATTAGTCTTVPVLSGEATTSGGSNTITLVNDAVIGKKLTSFTPVSGTIDVNDSLLTAIQKLYGIVASSGAATSSNLASRLVLRDTNGDFSAGTITGALNGNATSATTAITANSATTSGTCITVPVLSGEATTSGGSNTITLVNDAVIGKKLTSFTPVSGTIDVNDSLLTAIQKLYGIVASSGAATSSSTGSRLVLRDASGNFSAGTITATLSGNATSATSSGTCTTIPALSGQATTTGSNNVVTLDNAAVIGKTLNSFSAAAGAIGAGDSLLTAIQKLYGIVASSGAATSTSTASRLVLRDASGNFSAGTITATLSGNATTASDVPAAAVIGKTFTTFSASAGAIGAGDSLLTAIQKLYGIVASSGAATSSSTGSRLVLRDASGNFSANTITASLSGNATTASNVPNDAVISKTLTSFTSAAGAISATDTILTAIQKVDGNYQSQSFMNTVRVASTIALDMDPTAGTPAKFQSKINGALIMDGVTLNVDDRILLKDQGISQRNGIYIVRNSGSATTAFVIQRVNDAYGQYLRSDTTILVSQGVTQASQLFTLTTPAPITIDVTPLTFARIGETNYGMYERWHDTTQVTTAGTNVVNLVLFSANATKDTFNGGITYNAGDGSFIVNRKMRIQITATIPWYHTVTQPSPYMITLLMSKYNTGTAFDITSRSGDQSAGVPTNISANTTMWLSSSSIVELNSGDKVAVYFERRSTSSSGDLIIGDSNNIYKAKIVITELPN
jgi:hypothetical protein